MKLGTLRLLGILQIMALAGSGVFAQDQQITRSEFLTFMKRSEEATSAVPYRKNVMIEMGDTQDGTWNPYRSMVEEVIAPHRSHLIHKTGPPREYLRVGKSRYGKEMNGPWVLLAQEAEGWRVSPASEPVFQGPLVEYRIANPRETNLTTVLKVVSKPFAADTDLETKALYYTYLFDERGMLRQQVSVIFNGKKWVKTTETYEYDPNIRIEAPIN